MGITFSKNIKPETHSKPPQIASKADPTAPQQDSSCSTKLDDCKDKILANIGKDLYGDKFDPDATQYLGKGGSGSVYLCQKKHTDVPAAEEDELFSRVAIKIIQPSIPYMATDEQIKKELADIQQEFERIKTLANDYIIKVFKSYITSTKPYFFAFSMEYCPITLSTLLHNPPAVEQTFLGNIEKFHPKYRFILASHISAALNYLRECGIIHFDVKSDNVLITQHPSPSDKCNFIAKLSDFGLVTSENTSIEYKQPKGSLPYMAPELLAAEDDKATITVTSAVDIYSYGILFWEILTMHVPYKEIKPWTVRELVRQGVRPDINATFIDKLLIDPEILTAANNIIISCWHSDPTARPNAERINAILHDILLKIIDTTQKLPAEIELKEKDIAQAKPTTIEHTVEQTAIQETIAPLVAQPITESRMQHIRREAYASKHTRRLTLNLPDLTQKAQFTHKRECSDMRVVTYREDGSFRIQYK